MADALCATLIITSAGIRRSKSFELTASCRNQIEQVSEALKLDRYLGEINADFDGIQIPVDLIESAEISDRGYCHINGTEMPESVASNTAALKTAVTAAAAEGKIPAVFISLT